MLARSDGVHADGRLDLHRDGGTERLVQARRSGRLSGLDVVRVVVVSRVDIHHRPAAPDRRREAVGVDGGVEHQQAGRPRTAEKLVGREEDGIQPTVGVAVGRHVDLDVRAGRRVVEERQRPVAMQHTRDVVHRSEHAGHVGARREGTVQRPAFPLGVGQVSLQVVETDLPLFVEAHLDDGAEALAPRDFVRVVLVRADEHDGAFLAEVVHQPSRGFVAERAGQPEAEVAQRGRRNGDPEDLLQLVDGTRRPIAAAHDPARRPGVHSLFDGVLGLMQQVRRRAAGQAVLRVAVGVQRRQRPEVVLHEGELPPAGREVGVDERSLAEGRLNDGIGAEGLGAEGVGGEARKLHTAR